MHSIFSLALQHIQKFKCRIISEIQTIGIPYTIKTKVTSTSQWYRRLIFIPKGRNRDTVGQVQIKPKPRKGEHQSWSSISGIKDSHGIIWTSQGLHSLSSPAIVSTAYAFLLSWIHCVHARFFHVLVTTSSWDLQRFSELTFIASFSALWGLLAGTLL